MKGPMLLNLPTPSCHGISLHLTLSDLQMRITIMMWLAAAYLLTTPLSHLNITRPARARALLWSADFHPCLPCFPHCILSHPGPTLLLATDIDLVSSCLAALAWQALLAGCAALRSRAYTTCLPSLFTLVATTEGSM